MEKLLIKLGYKTIYNTWNKEEIKFDAYVIGSVVLFGVVAWWLS